MASGLDAQEAFLVATHRLGDPDALAGEYRRRMSIALGKTRVLDDNGLQ